MTMARRHRIRCREDAANPQGRIDRALRRIARFSPPNTWHVNLQTQYAAMMLRRFGRVVSFGVNLARPGRKRAPQTGGVA